MNYKKVYIEITNICNKSCSFCSASFRKKREMTLDEFIRVISEIKKHTQYIYLHIKGEPLLHHNLKEILSICSDNNIKVNITTNGSLLNINKDILRMIIIIYRLHLMSKKPCCYNVGLATPC